MIILPGECGHHQKKLEIPILQQPKSQQSMSELKPPTMNSSFLLNGMSSPRLDENNQSSFVQQKSNRFEETEVKAMKKSKFHEEMMSKSQKQNTGKINNKLAEKFVQNLKHSTFILKEKLLNQFQQKILTEKYVEAEIDFENISKLNLIINIMWEIVFLVVQVIAFIYLPFEIGFQLENNYYLNCIIMIQIIGDLLIFLFYTQKIIRREVLIDFILLTSNALILARNIPDECLFAAIFCQLITSLSKFEIKFKKWQDYIPYDLLNIRFIARVLVLLHYCACLWHFIGISESNSWITEQQIYESDNFTRYCYSIYWSTASLLHIGQASIMPITQIEFIYSVFIMLISCWIVATFFQNAYQCNNVSDEREQALRKQLRIVNRFFQDKKISFFIKAQIRNFLKVSNFTEANEKQTFLSQLSPQLTEELLLQMRTDALLKCKFIQRFSSSTNQKLTKYMEYITRGPSQEIEKADCSLYLIESGRVQIVEYGKVIQNLKSGDSFGEHSFFSAKPVAIHFKVVDQTSLFKIKQEDFIKLIYQNKQDYEKFMFLKDQVFNGFCRAINIFCNFCNSGMHTFSDCPLINYKPNLKKLFEKATSGTQERRKFIRDRDINHRLLNQVLKRHEINNEALSIFRMKMNFSFLEDSSDKSEEEFSDSDNSDDQQFTNNKTQDNYKDGTAISILKSNDYVNEYKVQHSVQEDEEIMRITSNSQQEPQLYLKEYGLQPYQPQFQISLVPVENKKSQTQIDQMQSQQMLSDWHIPSVTRIKQPSKNDVRQSSRKISSKLSTIRHIQSGTVQNFKSNVNPYSKSNLQLPNSHELVDLSMYKSNVSSEEFEVMFQFTIYYPSWNYKNVIQRLNYQIMKRLKGILSQRLSLCQSNSQLQSKSHE